MAEERHLQLALDDDTARARAFWKENGRSIVAGVLLGLGGIAGFNYWKSYQQTQGEQASILFEQLQSGQADADVKSVADQLKADFRSTAYADLAALAMAKTLVEASDLDAAVRELTWVMDNTKDSGFRHISRLRLAAVLLAQKTPDKALKILEIADKGSFESRYQELLGDAFAQRGLAGDDDLARSAYERSLLTLPEGASHVGLVQLKLDNIAGSNSGNG